jgi:hypothetical protein
MAEREGTSLNSLRNFGRIVRGTQPRCVVRIEMIRASTTGEIWWGQWPGLELLRQCPDPVVGIAQEPPVKVPTVYAVPSGHTGDRRTGVEHLSHGETALLKHRKLTNAMTASWARVTPSQGERVSEAMERVRHRSNAVSHLRKFEERVAAYVVGATALSLAGKHSIHRTTVLALLERQQVSMRGRVLTPDHIERAVSSYASGRSCASIGKELQVNPETIRQALLKAGVAMRRPGRPRATQES